ncbi:unnamed protein product [Brassica rapa]|uniref:Peptidase C1A papain C-terminal domain-containing protein n=1 Tax=Brassica campestris TaxID=3711 RepID=A0A3P6BDI0_BRACM|nr:unnamed protein product [Brassica rapa]VDC97164.1 unnamed protein product [Brassica rapa]
MLPWNWNVSRVGESKDWRKGGVVTPVKKQGGCGKLARITYYNKSLRIGKNYIHSIRNLVSLSKQQLIDCDRARNHGCKGGSMTYAFQYCTLYQTEALLQIKHILTK